MSGFSDKKLRAVDEGGVPTSGTCPK
ncbi:hypothetical protein PIIN_11118 [Serendipita indica DSM 11827]|uniref:Uncharacterized protein n=1 Tax=Serendipita indica (strain DSM 11827) TaxID=1109443 RepID=G4U0P2_SERID|nr:hypothetical protein PIIN_11118 [Serendipita indica DSM 11827]